MMHLKPVKKIGLQGERKLFFSFSLFFWGNYPKYIPVLLHPGKYFGDKTWPDFVHFLLPNDEKRDRFLDSQNDLLCHVFSSSFLMIICKCLFSNSQNTKYKATDFFVSNTFSHNQLQQNCTQNMKYRKN